MMYKEAKYEVRTTSAMDNAALFMRTRIVFYFVVQPNLLNKGNYNHAD